MPGCFWRDLCGACLYASDGSSKTHGPMTSYVSFALGTVLIVSASWLARRHFTPSVAVSSDLRFTNDDIVWV